VSEIRNSRASFRAAATRQVTGRRTPRTPCPQQWLRRRCSHPSQSWSSCFAVGCASADSSEQLRTRKALAYKKSAVIAALAGFKWTVFTRRCCISWLLHLVARSSVVLSESRRRDETDRRRENSHASDNQPLFGRFFAGKETSTACMSFHLPWRIWIQRRAVVAPRVCVSGGVTTPRIGGHTSLSPC